MLRARTGSSSSMMRAQGMLDHPRSEARLNGLALWQVVFPLFPDRLGHPRAISYSARRVCDFLLALLRIYCRRPLSCHLFLFRRQSTQHQEYCPRSRRTRTATMLPTARLSPRYCSCLPSYCTYRHCITHPSTTSEDKINDTVPQAALSDARM